VSTPAQDNGGMGPAELSGEISIMDFLVGVNNDQLIGLTFNEAMTVIRQSKYAPALFSHTHTLSLSMKYPTHFESWRFPPPGIR
jgi:hypothetical protein